MVANGDRRSSCSDCRISVFVHEKTFFGMYGMCGRIDFHIGPNQRVVADGNISGIQQRAVHIDQAMASHRNMAAVVLEQGLIAPDVHFAYSKEQYDDFVLKSPN